MKSMYDADSDYMLLDVNDKAYNTNWDIPLELIINSRHTKTTIILVASNLSDVAPNIRNNAICCIKT
jgi:hypothetical protein